MDEMVVTTVNRIIVIVLLSVPVLTSQGASAASIKATIRNPPPQACYQGGIVDVIELVNRAVALMEQRGAFPAFRQMMEPAGDFINGDLYVFVLNQQGTVLANGNSPQSVGANSLQARDQNGHYFIREILQRAFTAGDGWIGYHWYSPCNGKWVPKQVYFKRTGRFVVCAGFYNRLAI